MIGRRRRRGVVGTMAQTAVIAGTATAVSRGVSGAMDSSAQQKQQAQAANQAAVQTQADVEELKAQLAQQQAQQAQAALPQAEPATDAGADMIAKLQQLGDMKNSGLLTDAEFEAAKARVLGI